MNRDLVKAKSAKMARALNEVHGVPVMFRGAMIHVVISNRDGSLDLGNAGFRQSGLSESVFWNPFSRRRA